MFKLSRQGLAGLIASYESDDYTHEVVPASARRSSLTMALLWITMSTGFTNVMAGFQWHKAGFNLTQVLQASFFSFFLIMLYGIPACYLGCKSGLTWAVLSRRIFGHWGSYLVSFNLMWVNIGWYALNAVYLGECFRGLFHWTMPITVLAAILAVLMAFNNFFGFAGVANFARWLAGPLLIVWVGYTFVKALVHCPPSVLTLPSHQANMMALMQVSTLVLGFCIWGNEPDFWRFGKQSLTRTIWPFAISILVGGIIFPVTGWLMAQVAGISDYGQAAVLMTNYAFGGLTIVSAFALAVVFFANNDANLYGSINAVQNMNDIKRKHIVAFLTISCLIASVALCGASKAFEAVASLSSIFLPTVTVIMIAEWFLLSRLAAPEQDFCRQVDMSRLPLLRYPATIALIFGCTVGLATAGVIPGTEALHWGLCSVQAWAAALWVYLILRPLEMRWFNKSRVQEIISAQNMNSQANQSNNLQ